MQRLKPFDHLYGKVPYLSLREPLWLVSLPLLDGLQHVSSVGKVHHDATLLQSTQPLPQSIAIDERIVVGNEIGTFYAREDADLKQCVVLLLLGKARKVNLFDAVDAAICEAACLEDNTVGALALRVVN